MKRVLSALLIIIVGLSFSINTFAQEKKTKVETKKVVEEKTEKVVDEKTMEATAELNTVCPVSTEEADGEITAEYKGKKYAVCCKSCLKKFNKDPEKYISRLSEDGKSIKKK